MLGLIVYLIILFLFVTFGASFLRIFRPFHEPKINFKSGEEEIEYDLRRLKASRKHDLINMFFGSILFGVFSVLFVIYWYFPKEKNIFFSNGSALIFFVSCGVANILFYLLNLMSVIGKFSSKHGKEIKITNITKANQAKGLIDLEKAANSVSGGFGYPLMTFAELANESDPWNEKREKLVCSNSDRGLVIGIPGTGKTTYLIAQLIDWMQSGNSFVCTDIKPEIWGILKKNGLFDKFGYEDIVFNPVNPNGAHYNPLSEIDDVVELSDYLETLVPLGDAEAEVFNFAARNLLKAIILHLKGRENLTLNDVRKYINSFDGVDLLLDDLLSSEIEQTQNITKEVKRTVSSGNYFGSVLAALGKAFYFLDEVKIVETLNRSDFKFKEIFNRKKVALFLQFPESSQKLTKTIFSMMLNQSIDEVRKSATKRTEPVFMAFDEITNSAPIPDFKNKMLLLRSSNAPTFLYFQEITKIDELYGAGSINTFMGSATLKVVYRVGDNATAEYFNKALGKTEAIFKNKSKSDQGMTVSAQTQEVDVIDISRLMNMPNGKALYFYNGIAGVTDVPSYWKDYPLAAQNLSGDDKNTP